MWKILPATNTLAYWAHSKVTKKIKFVITAPKALQVKIGIAETLQLFLAKAGSGPRPRIKRVKNDSTLSADYNNIN